MIIDDESHVREAIKLLINWSSFGINCVIEASDGMEAINKIKQYKPEIIFTDMMMPEVNGVQLLQWISENHPVSKVVVISGHDDFDFVRNTVKYGGMDYLLKPIDADELQETLTKAIETWRKEEQIRSQNQRRNIQMNQLKPVYWDKIFSNFIEQPSYWSSIQQEVIEEFGIEMERDRGQVIILSLETMTSKVKNKFARQMDLLYFSLSNICNEFLRESGVGYAFRYWNRENELVLLLWDKFSQATEIVQKINEAILSILGGRFHFGIGTITIFPKEITKSYLDARHALRQRNVLERHRWIHEPVQEIKQTVPALHFSDFEERIRLSIQSSNVLHMEQAAREWIEAVKKLSYISMEHMEMWDHEYQVFKNQWLKDIPDQEAVQEPIAEEGQQNKLFIPINEEGTISMDEWMEELKSSFINISKKLSIAHQRQDHKVIYDIANFIEQNYHKDLSLQMISNHFYLSREYISRRFKQEMNENISDFISKTRVEKAKLLLLNPHLRISQISDMVGYQDEKYFSKVFKKLSGLTPNEYRKENS